MRPSYQKRLYKCPHCGTFHMPRLQVSTYTGVGTDRREGIRSDGLVLSRYSHRDSNFFQCDHCKNFFDQDEWAVLIDYRKYAHSKELFEAFPPIYVPRISGQLPDGLPDSFNEIQSLRPLGLENFEDFTKSPLFKGEEIHKTRLEFWQVYNSLIVELEETRNDTSQSQEIARLEGIVAQYKNLNIRNLRELDTIYSSDRKDQYLIRAEIKRHLGEYAKSRKLLLKVPLDQFYNTKILRKMIRRRSKGTFMLIDTRKTWFDSRGKLVLAGQFVTELFRKVFHIYYL